MIRDSKYVPLNASAGMSFLTLIIILGIFLPEGLIPATGGLNKMEITALAVLVTSLVGFLTVRLFTSMKLECKPHPRIFAHVLCTGITVATLNFITWYYNITVVSERIFIYIFLGIFIYGICLYLAGEFLHKDYTTFKELTKED